MNIKQKLTRIKEEIEIMIEELDRNPTKKTKYQPTEEQIKRWKGISPTKKTLDLLLKKGFSEEEVSQIKTQYDAHIILNEN